MTIYSSHTYTVTDQAARWNANSAARLHELGSNDDPSYRALSHLILQKLTGLLPDGHGSVLDVGCGIGFLSSHIASLGFTVVGIDPADQGIEIASTTHTQPHLQFEATSLEDYAYNHPNASFDALVANMVLHCVPNHYSFFAAAARLLAADGAFIATLPNPRYLSARKKRCRCI
jgi:ribosomal protein L11 methyltransferase (prmA)